MNSFFRSRRIFFIMLFILLVFNLLAVRLFQVQILQSASLTARAVEQRSEKLVLGSGRGDIYDRNGDCLLGSYSHTALVVFPALTRGREEEIMVEYPWIPKVEKVATENETRTRPYVLAGNFKDEKLLTRSLPEGIIFTTMHVRYGPEYVAPHVLGYTKGAGGSGVFGLELFFEEELSSGRPPTLAALVDGRRRLIPGLGYRFWEDRHVSKPYNLHLTLDKEIQESVEEVMKKRVEKGAVVVMEPKTGDILALASQPDFAPDNISAFYLDTQESKLMLEQHPFLNRSVRSYFPGSTYKAILAAAALEAGIISPEDTYHCPGYIDIGQNRIHCSAKHGHGELDLAEALAHSCNVAFIEIGLEVGSATFLDYMDKFAFGQSTGLPLQGERPGNIPAPGADRGIVALASIGQGDVGVTPLQLARAYSAIANGGILPEARLIEKVTSKTGLRVKSYPAVQGERVISSATAEKLRDMMHGVTGTGTGRDAVPEHYEVAGKTGTAETGKVIDGDKEFIYWFGGFAPLEDPEYVVVVFLEEKKGKVTPGTVFKEVVERILPKK